MAADAPKTGAGTLLTEITYFGQPARVACDRRCEKAWGINNRPRVNLSDDPDDYAFLADGEVGEAPDDPGIYEGGHGKPMHPARHNKWCVRECERSALARPDEPLHAKDFSRRRFNMPPLYRPEAEQPAAPKYCPDEGLWAGPSDGAELPPEDRPTFTDADAALNPAVRALVRGRGGAPDGPDLHPTFRRQAAAVLAAGLRGLAEYHRHGHDGDPMGVGGWLDGIAGDLERHHG